MRHLAGHEYRELRQHNVFRSLSANMDAKYLPTILLILLHINVNTSEGVRYHGDTQIGERRTNMYKMVSGNHRIL